MAENPICVDCEPKLQHETTNTDSQPTPHLQNPLDPKTFIPPDTTAIAPSVIIEFCDRCRWLHRATWVSTELFLTFPTPALRSITILPLNAEDTAGRFRVWLTLSGLPPLVVWDRKVEGGFPELKVLKQRIRDHIQPGKSLGHSDK
ncbi:Rdx family-domain-containing protein [Trametes gibbosa]|nr:Rdx family-domain-containing protein [Trametes gibbosa]